MSNPLPPTPFRLVLILLCLTFSQAWLTQHELEHTLSGELNDCTICLHADNQGQTLDAITLEPPRFQHIKSHIDQAARGNTRQFRHFASRAPPIFLPV